MSENKSHNLNNSQNLIGGFQMVYKTVNSIYTKKIEINRTKQLKLNFRKKKEKMLLIIIMLQRVF